MDESDQQRKQANFLDQTIKLVKDKKEHSGRVLYFSEKVIILQKQDETLEVINISKFEGISIQVLEQDENHSSKLYEELVNEVVTPSQVLSKIME